MKPKQTWEKCFNILSIKQFIDTFKIHNELIKRNLGQVYLNSVSFPDTVRKIKMGMLSITPVTLGCFLKTILLRPSKIQTRRDARISLIQ